MATIIRSDAIYTPVFYAIGIGGTIPADPVDDIFMGAVDVVAKNGRLFAAIYFKDGQRRP